MKGNEGFSAEERALLLAVKGVGRDDVQVTLLTADGKEATLGWKLAREGAPPPENKVTAAIADTSSRG